MDTYSLKVNYNANNEVSERILLIQFNQSLHKSVIVLFFHIFSWKVSKFGRLFSMYFRIMIPIVINLNKFQSKIFSYFIKNYNVFIKKSNDIPFIHKKIDKCKI